MNPVLRVLFTTCLMFLINAHSYAAAILVSDFRSVESSVFIGSEFDGSGDLPWRPFEDFNGLAYGGVSFNAPEGVFSYSETGQISSVSSTSFVGTMYAGAHIDDPLNLAGEYDASNAEAFYDIRFDLLTPHEYTLTGALTYDGGLAGYVNRVTLGSLSLSLTDSPFSLNGVLQPGSYQFLVATEIFAGPGQRGNAKSSFDLQLSEVPVPAALWLFGSGLIGLIGIARGKKV